MRRYIHNIYHRILVLLHLSPLSLAEKCRIAFGAAVVFILAIALLLPYFWMGQLTEKACIDAGRAMAQTLLNKHFSTEQPGKSALPPLDSAGAVMDVNNPQIRWVRFSEQGRKQLEQFTDEQRQIIELLKADETRGDRILLTKKNGVLKSDYVKVFKATDSCISCHNPQGPASPFGRNEPIGAVVIQSRGLGGEIGKTILMNRIWIIVAGLIGGVGAFVAFYWITQRVILSPVRQLRALANNVAEGNLGIRSSINTRDEYEKLANAFNHMLDSLQATQEKLRQANKQLDDKIAELSERNIELFRANKIKGEFLANISHEFRTPLNAILGFAEILREKPARLGSDKIQRYADNIITGGKNLLNMLNDLLDLAKAEAGKMQLHIEKTTVKELCDALVRTFSALTKKKKIKVKTILDDNLPVLDTDVGKVRQILYNFLSNAVKFTPKGGRIEIRATTPDEKTARIAITDTGCGIAEADKEKIFEKFRQVDGSITRQSPGSGLGLAISKELATILAGSVGFESEVGKGSTFWLDIPATLAKDEKPNGQN
jgi:two-component system, NarL family, sensor histidine kinase BarA